MQFVEDRFNNRNQYVSEINQNPAENWPRQNVMQGKDLFNLNFDLFQFNLCQIFFSQRRRSNGQLQSSAG